MSIRWWQLTVAGVVGVTAGVLLSLEQWSTYRPDLLVFLGIYAAALLQVAVTSANLSLPDYLDPVEAEKLSNQLMKQQRYWIGLFISVISSIFALLVVTYAKQDIVETSITLARLAGGLLGFLFVFLACQTFYFMEGLLSLQRLRGHYLIVGAQRKQAEKAEAVARGAADRPEFKVPEGHGEIFDRAH